MSDFVKNTKEINDAASLSIIVDLYLKGGNTTVEDTLDGTANILEKCVAGHHQSREMAGVALKLVKGF